MIHVPVCLFCIKYCQKKYFSEDISADISVSRPWGNVALLCGVAIYL